MKDTMPGDLTFLVKVRLWTWLTLHKVNYHLPICRQTKKSIVTPSANSPEHNMQASLGSSSQLSVLKEGNTFYPLCPFYFWLVKREQGYELHPNRIQSCPWTTIPRNNMFQWSQRGVTFKILFEDATHHFRWHIQELLRCQWHSMHQSSKTQKERSTQETFSYF